MNALQSQHRTIPKRHILTKGLLLSKKSLELLLLMGEGFYLVFRHGLYKSPNQPAHTKYVQYFCRRLGRIFNVEVQVHGDVPRAPAMWIANHISWLDAVVLGSGTRSFFLAKDEVRRMPIFGRLVAWGGTLFVKRGSGTSQQVRAQIAQFLQQDIPVTFFPEATTGDGATLLKVHDKLLGAALDAKKPVNICLICYVNKYGERDTVVPFVGEQSLLENILNVMLMNRVVAHLLVLPTLETTGYDLAELTQEIRQRMATGLALLQQQVLTDE